MSRYIEDADALKARYGTPGELSLKKVIRHLDRHCRQFIELSPYLVIATSDRDGRVDASPRGDGPGFVTVADDTTLHIPDRKGNRRLDTLLNLVENPGVGLLFMIPGVNETLRINGTARICIDEAVLAPHAVRGRLPESVVEVTVAECYLQCAKALVRSHLWDPSHHVERSTLPSLGQILADQIGGLDAKATDEHLAVSNRERLY